MRVKLGGALASRHRASTDDGQGGDHGQRRGAGGQRRLQHRGHQLRHRSILDRQPLPRNYYSIIQAAPGVNVDYTASSGSAMLAYGGNGERQNAFTLDGVNVADAAAGQHWILPSIQWMQEIQVGGLGANAEYGGYTGGIINGVTKSGGNTFHGGIEYYYEPSSWVSNNDPTAENPETKFSDVSVSLGGPVIVGQAVVLRLRRVLAPGDDPGRGGGRPPTARSRATSASSRSRRARKTASRSWASTTTVTNDRRGISVYTLPDATSKQEAPGASFALNWESLVNADNFLSVKLTGYDGRDDYLPVPRRGHPGPHRRRQRHRSGSTRTSRSSTTGTWSPRTPRGACSRTGCFGANDSHSFKFGAVYETGTSSDQWLRNGGFTYYDYSGDCDSLDAYFADPTCGPYYVERGWGEYNEWPKFSGLHVLRAGLAAVRPVHRQRRRPLRQLRRRLAERPRRQQRLQRELHRPARRRRVGRHRRRQDRPQGALGPLPRQGVHLPVGPRGLGTRGGARPGLLLELRHEPVQRLRSRLTTVAARMGKVDHPYVDETLLTFEQQFEPGHVDRGRPHRPAVPQLHGDDEQQPGLRAATPRPATPTVAATSRSTTCSRRRIGCSRRTTPRTATYQSAVLRFEKRYSHGW